MLVAYVDVAISASWSPPQLFAIPFLRTAKEKESDTELQGTESLVVIVEGGRDRGNHDGLRVAAERVLKEAVR